MKTTFFMQNFEFKGIMNNIYHRSKAQYPIVTSGNKAEPGSELIELITNPSTAEILIKSYNDSQYIQFDLGDKNKAIITQYQIQTMVGSPPCSWHITASNSHSFDSFEIIANVSEFLNMCDIISTDKTQCINRTTNKFQCNETYGPFQYFRFYVDLCLYGYYHNNRNDKGVRIGGLELFGALLDRKETTTNFTSFHFISLIQLLLIPCILFQI